MYDYNWISWTKMYFKYGKRESRIGEQNELTKIFC